MSDLRAAAILDRDGTIIEERQYLADPEGVVLLPGAVDALRTLRAAGYLTFVVSNQSGVARGLIDKAAAEAVHRRFALLLSEAGASPDATFYCFHHPDYGCECRKPRPGLVPQKWNGAALDYESSFVFGDKEADLQLAEAIGSRGILVRTGYGAQTEQEAPDTVRRHAVYDDLAAAVHALTQGPR